jgi:hypothetical protein
MWVAYNIGTASETCVNIEGPLYNKESTGIITQIPVTFKQLSKLILSTWRVLKSFPKTSEIQHITNFSNWNSLEACNL